MRIAQILLLCLMAVSSVPAKDAASVTESGKAVDAAEGVKFLRMENGAAVYAVGSGTYQFQSTLNKTVKWYNKKEIQ